MGSLKDSKLLPSEHDEQAVVVEWWRLQYPDLARVLFAIPNGGLRPKQTGAFLQKEGVVPGVADMFLAYPTNHYHGLFIEMKRREGGKQSPQQKAFEKAIRKQGYGYLLANGADNAISGIKGYLMDIDIY